MVGGSLRHQRELAGDRNVWDHIGKDMPKKVAATSGDLRQLRSTIGEATIGLKQALSDYTRPFQPGPHAASHEVAKLVEPIR
jgi:hypothetical protein